MAQGGLGLLAFEEFIRALAHTADLPRERQDEMFIALGEGPSLVTDETDPTVDICRRRDGCGQKRLNFRMERRELQSGRIATRIVATQRPALGDDRLEHPREGV